MEKRKSVERGSDVESESETRNECDVYGSAFGSTLHFVKAVVRNV